MHKNIVESVKDITSDKDTITCPSCGACMDAPDYPRDTVIKEKIKLLEDVCAQMAIKIRTLKRELNNAANKTT